MAAVIGVDLSLTRTGVCDGLGRGTVLDLSTDTWFSACEQVIRWVLTRCMPDTLVVIERPYASQLPYVTDMMMMHGALRYSLEVSEVKHLYVSPSALKVLATGNGRATKADMRMAWFRRGGTDLVDDNAVDAQWLWVAGMLQLGYNVLQLPESHTKATIGEPERRRGRKR